ncbi:MAG: VOC family protein, partial [Actinomycetes bacterium]
MPIRSLGYLRLTTPEIDAWRSFGPDVLGLMPVSGGDPDALYYRIDDRPPRLVVSPGEPGIAAIGFEVADARELAALVDRVKSAGVAVTDGTEAEAEERRVEAFVHFEDPRGHRVEAYFSPILDHVSVVTPLVSGFVTGAMGMGHVVVAAPDIDSSFRFWTDVLGFRHRDSMRVPMGPDTRMYIRFLGCN